MIVWIASYPRSGNSFLRLVFESVFGLSTYSIYDERRTAAPGLGPAPPLPRNVYEPRPELPFDVERFADRPELHVVKTHGLPLDSRPAIYVVRDGREATASYYYYQRDAVGQPHAVRDILHGRVGFGSWGRHVSVWDPQHRPNTLLIRFDSLTTNPIAQVERIGAFLGVTPVGNRVPTFEELRSQAPRLFRSGRPDSWRSLFSETDHEEFWDLHGDEMRRMGYGGAPAMPGSRLARLWRRRRRLVSRAAEASRPFAAAGRSAAMRAISLTHRDAPYELDEATTERRAA